MDRVFMYGGTFDPVHKGHLQTAQSVYDTFKPDEFTFIPCKQPLLKQSSQATAQQRLTMLGLGIQTLNPKNAFTICPFELQSQSPSYTVFTLQHLHEKYPKDTAFTLIMGMDAFSRLHQWHQWRELLTLSNILIIERPGYSLQHLNTQLKEVVQHHCAATLALFSKAKHGSIFPFNCGEYVESSTEIRQKISMHASIGDACPPAVADYIRSQQLYLPDS